MSFASFRPRLRASFTTLITAIFCSPAEARCRATVDFSSEAAAATGAAVATAAADTYLELGLYFDGVDLLVYSNNLLVARVSSPTIGTSGTTLTSVALGPVMQITPTATDTLTVDYILASTEVTR